VKSNDKRRVSMERVEDTEGHSKSPLWVASVSSLFAVGAGFIILLVIAADVRDSLHRRGDALSLSADAPGHAAGEKRGFLSPAQAKHVCVAYDSVISADSKDCSEWACSICLEDREAGADVRTVLLPCSHRFHRSCV
jgi:hypothetical protein